MSKIAAAGTMVTTKHAMTSVRHEPRRRLLAVQRAERITPNMAR